MNNNSTKVVLEFSGNCLILYHLEYEGDERVNFSSQVYSNQQIVNPELFDELVANFIAKVDLPAQSAVLTFTDNLIFHKELNSDPALNISVEKVNFLKTLPIKFNDLVCLQIQVDEKIHILACNKQLFLSIKKIFENFKWQIRAVVPVSVFDNVKAKNLSIENVSQILNSEQILEMADFLNAEEFESGSSIDSSNVELKKDPQSSLLTIILIFILTFLIASITIFVLAKLHFSFRSFIPQSSKPKSSLTIPVASQSATSSPVLSKEDLKIKVLNGSGVSGKAAVVKMNLEKLGYKNIETGNTIFQDQPSVITFSKEVSDDIKDEVKKELQKNYPDILTQNSNDTDAVNILIQLFR